MDLVTIEEHLPATRDALDEWRPGDAWLAGGTGLFSAPDPTLRRLLDLRAFGWPPFTVTAAGLEIAATATVRQLHDFDAPPDWPAATLFRLAPRALYASWKIWGEATVGGNLCLALPAGALGTLCVALDGVATVWGPANTTRTLPVTELITGASETSLRPGELLRSVTLPAHALGARVAHARASLSPRGRSAALVFGRAEPDGRTVLALGAATRRTLRLEFPAPPDPQTVAAALNAADPPWYDDVHGDPAWRAHLSARLLEQVRGELCN